MIFIDTYEDILHYFPSEEFNIRNWGDYSKLISPHLYEKVEKDISDYNFDKDVLPVIIASLKNKEKIFWEQLKDKVEIIEPLFDTPYGTRKFTIKDLDGNELGFCQ